MLGREQYGRLTRSYGSGKAGNGPIEQKANGSVACWTADLRGLTWSKVVRSITLMLRSQQNPTTSSCSPPFSDTPSVHQ